MEFSDIETRGENEWVFGSWFNYLRNAGIILQNRLAAYAGAGASTSEQVAAIANNQTGANVTGLIASNLYRRTEVRYWLIRIATATVMQTGKLDIMFDGTNYYLGDAPFGPGGVVFDVHPTTGQVIYDSTNMTGSYDTGASKVGFSVTTQGTI